MKLRSAPSRSAFVALVTAVAIPALIQGAACTSDVAVATVIGPSGGTVAGPHGAQVVIPAGALSRPTSIAIRTVPASSAPALSSGFTYAGEVYTFEPHGLVFDAPVQIRLPRDGAPNSAVLHAACAANSAGAAQCSPWDAPLDGVDAQPGFAVVSAKSFSLYATADLQGTGGAGGTSTSTATATSTATGTSTSTVTSTGTGAGGCAACAMNEECDGADHCIELLAAGLNAPTAIALDAANVYWTSDDGAVMKCGVGGCGGVPTTLSTVEVHPVVMAVDGTHVYWGNHGIGGTDGAVRRCAVGGCNGTPEQLATNVFTNAIAVANGQLYFTEITPMGPAGAGLIMQCPASGCVGPATQIATVDGVPFGLGASQKHLIWGANATTAGQTPTIMACSPSGCAPTALASGSGLSVRQMAMDAASVYWTDGDFSVKTCPLTGCPNLTPITLVALGNGSNIPEAITSDGVDVYFTVVSMGGTPAVMKCAASGCKGQPTTLATGAKIIEPNGIAVDGTHVYWTDRAGTVMRTAK